MPGEREAMERVDAYLTGGPSPHMEDFAIVLSLAQRAEKAEAERDEAQAVAIEMSTDLTAAEARVKALEGALEKIARGETPHPKHGHYLAHREAVKLARTLLTKETS